MDDLRSADQNVGRGEQVLDRSTSPELAHVMSSVMLRLPVPR